MGSSWWRDAYSITCFILLYILLYYLEFRFAVKTSLQINIHSNINKLFSYLITVLFPFLHLKEHQDITENNLYTLLNGAKQSFLYKNHCEFYKKLPSRPWPVLFTLAIFFLLDTLLVCGKIKSCCDHCFPQQIRPQNTVQLHKLRDFSSGRIVFNTNNNKRHSLPIVYTNTPC